MKAGFQTILYGTHIDDLEDVLDTIQQAGFQGVEFFQQPCNICLRNGANDTVERANIADLVHHLKKRGLTFLGLTSGKLEERVRFCDTADVQKMAKYGLVAEDCKPLYFYVECAGEARSGQINQPGMHSAVHPHAFKELDSLATAREMLKDIADGLYWIPDTAHLFIQGENPVTEIVKLPKERIIAVHVKDWDAAYGHASHRYAKGFTQLGKGDVPLTETLQALHDWGWDGWLVYEQDYPNTTRADCIRNAITWFAAHGLPVSKDAILQEDDTNPVTRLKDFGPEFESKYTEFVKTLHQASGVTLSECYLRASCAIGKLFSACHVAFWSYNAMRPEMCLLAEYKARPIRAKRDLRLNRELSPLGRSAETMQPEKISFMGAEGAKERDKLQWREAITELEAECLISIPIPNRYNPNQVRFVVGILLDTALPSHWEEICWLMADVVARAVDAALDDACAYVTERTNFLADRAEGLNQFLQHLHGLIEKQLECEGVALFFTSRDERHLVPRYTPTTHWWPLSPNEERGYIPTDITHPTCRCWQERRAILLADSSQLQPNGVSLVPKSSEVNYTSLKEKDSILFVPMLTLRVEAGGRQTYTCMGVVRCRNKTLKAGQYSEFTERYFTDDDIALCSSICAAAVPHIELWLNEQWQTEAFTLMIHEMYYPLNMTMHAMDRMVTEFGEMTPNPLHELKNPIHKRIDSWITLMQRVVGSADALGFEYDYLEPSVQRVSLLGDVLAPAVAQIRQVAKRRNFDPSYIHYDGFDTLPLLHIDSNLFQQVFFNLFSNAIKYAFDAPETFYINIRAERCGGWFCITFGDGGPGIDEEFREIIFERGRRGPKHTSALVPGIGMGLWIVRNIVEKHGGTVNVTHTYHPMEFTIKLPTYLEHRAPKF